eukprot:3039715-Amphidinium_carterae.1
MTLYHWHWPIGPRDIGTKDLPKKRSYTFPKPHPQNNPTRTIHNKHGRPQNSMGMVLLTYAGQGCTQWVLGHHPVLAV